MKWDDRRVHASMPDGSMIVRYDRAGKWYQEWPAEQLKPRRALMVRTAANLAKDALWVEFGLPGGSTFDRIAQRAKYAKKMAPND